MNSAAPNIDPWFFNHLKSVQARVTERSLHHGLTMSGVKGIGKFLFAKAIALELLCQHRVNNAVCNTCQGCLLFAAGSHPDLHIVESDKQIGVDAVRQALNKLNNTAQIGPNKVCIINNAESLTVAASNALLKTLEEPTNNTYLILVTESQNQLLPTILSRTEKQVLHGPSVEQTKEWLAQYVEQPVPDLLFSLFQSSPYALKALLNDETLPDISSLEEDIEAVLDNAGLALTLAKRWEAFADVLLKVCTQLTQKRYLASLSASAYAPYQNCLNSHIKLQKAGLNKMLLLQSVLQSTALALKE